jgi:hypothetical protein
LKNKDVALNGKRGMAAQVGVVNPGTLLNGDVIRRTVCTFLQRKIIERLVGSFFVVVAPVKERADARKAIEQRVTASRLWRPLFGNGLIDSWVALKIAILVLKEVPNIPKIV